MNRQDKVREAYKTGKKFNILGKIEKPAVYRLVLLEQVTGVEPAYAAWEAAVLPVNYTCKRIP